MNKIDWEGFLPIIEYILTLAWYALITMLIADSSYHIVIKIFLFIGIIWLALKKVVEWHERG